MGLTGRSDTRGFWLFLVVALEAPSDRHHCPDHQTVLEAHQKSLHKVVTSAASVQPVGARLSEGGAKLTLGG